MLTDVQNSFTGSLAGKSAIISDHYRSQTRRYGYTTLCSVAILPAFEYQYLQATPALFGSGGTLNNRCMGNESLLPSATLKILKIAKYLTMIKLVDTFLNCIIVDINSNLRPRKSLVCLLCRLDQAIDAKVDSVASSHGLSPLAAVSISSIFTQSPTVASVHNNALVTSKT